MKDKKPLNEGHQPLQRGYKPIPGAGHKPSTGQNPPASPPNDGSSVQPKK